MPTFTAAADARKFCRRAVTTRVPWSGRKVDNLSPNAESAAACTISRKSTSTRRSRYPQAPAHRVLTCCCSNRPDALCEPEEVAEAFDTSPPQARAKCATGVSNPQPGPDYAVAEVCKAADCRNQLQLSLTNAKITITRLHVNMLDEFAVDRDGGVLNLPAE